MRSIKKLFLIYTVLGILLIQQPSYAGFHFKFPKFFKSKKEKKIEQTNPQTQQEQEQNTYEEEIVPQEGETAESGTAPDEENQNITDAIYISQVEIFGNNIIETSFIKDQLSSKEGYIYDRKNISADLNKIYKTGYFTQNIRAVPLRAQDGGIRLRIIVEENPPIKGFTVEGNNVVATRDIMDILSQYEGQPQNILNINSAIEQIQEMYSIKGYILARVTSVQDDPDGIVNILVDEGVINDVIVEGNYKTRDFIVKRNILLQPGTVYNENIMRDDILRLMGTQAFKDVKRDIEMDPSTGRYNVTVSLDEQRTGKISLGVGVDSTSGFFGSVGFSENNFRGLGQKLSINFMAGTGILMNDSSIINRPNLQAELGFIEPHFKSENQSLGFRAFARNFGSYQVPLSIEKRYGADITLTRRFKAFRNLSGSISFGGESVDLEEGDEWKARGVFASKGINFNERAKQLDGGVYAKITPALTYDTRDTVVNTRRGVLARLSLEESIGFGSDSFGKLYGMLKKFVPVGRKSTFVLAARAGGKIHGDMPEFAAYALGGPYTIRGFNISEVGTGDGFMMGTAEFRTPIPFMDRLTTNTFLNNVRLAAFMDAGTIFGDSLTNKLYDRPGYAITAGVGLRVFIPGLGPINLDYAIPFTNTGGKDRSNGFFTFGMGEMY